MSDYPNELITDALSAAEAWYPGQGLESPADYYELCGSLEKWMIDFKDRRYGRSAVEKYTGRGIPYNTSPFHFMLYYAPPPNRPFVLFSADSIMFGFFGGKKNDRLNISFPVYGDIKTAVVAMDGFLNAGEVKSLLRAKDINNFLLRDIDENFANALIKEKYSKTFRLSSLKELNYRTYDIQSTLAMVGKDFSNLRWRLNQFKRGKHRVDHISLSETREQVIHLIGQWRRQALKERDFSYADVRSDRFGAGFFGNSAYGPGNESGRRNESANFTMKGKVISRVLKVDGKTASFNLGYPLGITGDGGVFAHAIGISDITIPGLSEYAQVDFWKQVYKSGYGFINDGPTWRKGLAVYKDKFRPVMRERYYWATVDIEIDG